MGWTNPLPIPAPLYNPAMNKNPNTKATYSPAAGGIVNVQQKVSSTGQAAAPKKAAPAPVGGPGGPAPSQTNNNTATSTQVDPSVAAAAANDALLAQRRSAINSKLDTYNSLFDSLYGRIDKAAADQSDTARKNYGVQRDATINDYNSQVPAVDLSYYLSGVGDSSLRLGGLGKAETAENNALSTIQTNQDADLATIGQTAATKRAAYQADQGNIANVRNAAANSTNANELWTLQNDTDNSIKGITADSAGFDTAGGFRDQLAKVAPTKDLGPITSTLHSLMNGAANQALKTQIATQLISNSGASDEDKNKLIQTFLNPTPQAK